MKNLNNSNVRIADVAKLANVGAGTVSRVLNSSPSVAAETKQKVLDAIAKLGYVPNLVARSLAANRTGLIAAIIPAIGYTQHSEVVQGMTEVLHANGMNLMIGTSGYSVDTELKVIEAFLARRPDAIYVTGVRHSQAIRSILERSGIPVIEGSNLTEAPIDTVVGYSNFQAFADLTTLLIDQGFRHLWHVTVNKDLNDRIDDRLHGFRHAISSPVTRIKASVIRCENSFAGGAQAVRSALEHDDRIDALLFATDVMAVGGLLECQRLGVKVPERLAVSGFDDLTIASSINPTLTTVHVDRVGLGRKVAEIIVERLRGQVKTPLIVDVGFKIVTRCSTRGGQTISSLITGQPSTVIDAEFNASQSSG